MIVIVSFPLTDAGLRGFGIHEDDRGILEMMLILGYNTVMPGDRMWMETDRDGRVREIRCPPGIRLLPSSIAEMQTLQELTIGTTSELTNLPEEIVQMQALRKLNVNCARQLTSIPREIGNLRNLVQLSLGNTGVAILPSSIGQLKNLRELNLDHMRNLRSLPNEIGNLDKLVKLTVVGSGIQSLPPSIGQLQALRELVLIRTHALTVLPEEIGNLGSLNYLILHGSGITSLPPSIGRLQALQELALGKTRQLKALPEEIGNLGNLIRLDLSYSGINSISPSIGRLQALQELHIGGIANLTGPNPTGELPREIGNLANLIDLDLSSLDNVRSIPRSIENDLAVSRFRSRVPRAPTAVQWPIVLENATRAFVANGTSSRKGSVTLRGFEPHEAMHRIVTEYRESFVHMLMNRNSEQK